MSAIAAIAPRVAHLIRLLGSSQDGEALGACRALGRVLANAGADFHELAASIEAQAAPCYWHAEARWLDKRAESLTRADRVFVQSVLAGHDEPTMGQTERLRALYQLHKGRAWAANG